MRSEKEIVYWNRGVILGFISGPMFIFVQKVTHMRMRIHFVRQIADQ